MDNELRKTFEAFYKNCILLFMNNENICSYNKLYCRSQKAAPNPTG